MKKIFALISSLIIALSLTACGTNMDGNESDGNNNNSSKSGSSILDSALDRDGSNMNQTNAEISREEAKNIAFKHAGVLEAQITQLDVSLDSDNGVLKYEIDFKHGGIEYEYDINAQNGEILSSKKDTN